VTDGVFGAAVFDFKSPHDPLEARKSWFFFDKEYVCLGAGINSDSPFPVATTINQSLLNGEVVIRSKDQSSNLSKGVHELTDVQWILHDSIAYLFPQPVKLSLSNQVETGSWYKINHQSDTPKGEVKKEVFKAWISHGVKPENASYQYIVVPATNEKELLNLPGRQVKILANSTDLQAVQHSGLNISEMVFYKAGQMQIAKDLTIGIDGPGLVMAKTDGSRLTSISVSDPSRKLGRIHLTVSAKIEQKGTAFTSWWNEGKGLTEITLDLPQTVYAGKSVTITL